MTALNSRSFCWTRQRRPLTVLFVAAVMLVITTTTTIVTAHEEDEDEDGSARRLLMIGNSYSHQNGLSHMVTGMLSEHYDNSHPVVVVEEDEAEDDEDDDDDELVMTKKRTIGGATFEKHIQSASNFIIDQQPWNWVILQEQSLIGGLRDINPTHYDTSLAAAVSMNDMIASVGAETIFLMTWGREKGDTQHFPTAFPNFLTMNDQLSYGYGGYVEATSTDERPTKLAPVGLAFQEVCKFPSPP